MDRLVCIGLDRTYVDDVKAASGLPAIFYETPPAMHSHRGRLFAESPSVAGKMLQVGRVIWYGYFPGNPLAAEVRRAIALSDVPSFPDVRKAILHDDRALSLLIATAADPGPRMSRGYIPAGTRCIFPEMAVLKVGNDHCGDGKLLLEGVLPDSNLGGIVEPFIKGESIRALVVGRNLWMLKYESADWRKNVKAKVTEIHAAEPLGVMSRARTIAETLDIPTLGVDFIGSNEDGWVVLEVNAYPGLDDVVEAQDKFRKLLCAFVS